MGVGIRTSIARPIPSALGDDPRSHKPSYSCIIFIGRRGREPLAVRFFRNAGLSAALSGRALGGVQRAGRCAVATTPGVSLRTRVPALMKRMTAPPR
jgi:hypothetical protein